MSNPIEALQEFVGDNPQALEVLDQAKQTFTGAVEKLQNYETELKKLKDVNAEVIGSRDKLKNLIRETLGVEEVSRDAILGRLSAVSDVKLKEQYERQAAETKKAYTEQLEDYKSKLAQYETEVKNLKLQNAISTTDVMGQVQGPQAGKILQQLLAEGAEFDENGKLIYVGKAGEPLLNSNGEPMTLEDKIAEIKKSKEYDFLFQPRFLNGGGAPGTQGTTASGPASNPATGAKLTRTKMSMEEKKAYVDKYGMEAYNKLPLV